MQYENVFNIDDYSEFYYDENYRLLFDVRSCTENFRDRAFISFEAVFGE